MTPIHASAGQFLPVILVPLFLVVAVASIVWHFNRSSDLLQKWAQRNGYRLISSQYRWLARGPFWWRTSKGQSVYRVEIEDSQGQYRSGFVRVGGWFLGLWSDVASVEWDD